MIHIRPLVGAFMISLLLAAAPVAGQVEVITPGGHTSLTPPDVATEPRDTGTTALTPPRTDESDSSDSDSDEVDVQPGLQTMHFGGATLACRVGPGARDLVVVNQSPEPLPPGTRVKWQLKNEGTRGFFAIIGELGGGQSLVADNILDGNARADDVCTARVI